jgi:hypothetical protein
MEPATDYHCCWGFLFCLLIAKGQLVKEVEKIESSPHSIPEMAKSIWGFWTINFNYYERFNCIHID